MKVFKLLVLNLLFLSFCQIAYAQNEGNTNSSGGVFSGSLEANGNFFMTDSAIGAVGTPQYDRQLYGADAWLDLRYSNWGFDFGVRFDMFNNSNLLNPIGSYSDQGIGRWFVRKKIDKLGISAGYLYDQIGSGVIFRAYEERPLAIDNALYGVRLTYDLLEDWQVKAFSGKQKQLFDYYGATIRGLSVDGFLSGGEESGWSIAPGAGVVNRTIDDETMEGVVNQIATYNVQDSTGLRYNSYAMTLYNTLTVGKFSWYFEGAYKTEDVMTNPLLERLDRQGTSKIPGKIVLETGNVLYSSFSYSTNGFGGTLELKRTENFNFRTDPFVVLNRGIINFLPPMTRVNTYRLTSRYAPATQEFGEKAVQLDLSYASSRKLRFNVNLSNITTLEDDLLYRELYSEVTYKYKRKWTLIGGLQYQQYNQEVFEEKPDVGILTAVTPFFEVQYKLSRKKSIRFEAQYMDVAEKKDFGSWAFALVEFSVAPSWSFTVSDMYNVSPTKRTNNDDIHYPRVDIFYTKKSNRFSLSYVKQVEGIVCSGGICRLEPAFSGVKMSVNSTF